MPRTAHHSMLCATNPLGAKGAGESGVAGSLPSAANAIVDALSGAGIDHLDLPASPEHVWRALSTAGREHGRGSASAPRPFT